MTPWLLALAIWFVCLPLAVYVITRNAGFKPDRSEDDYETALYAAYFWPVVLFGWIGSWVILRPCRWAYDRACNQWRKGQ